MSKSQQLIPVTSYAILSADQTDLSEILAEAAGPNGITATDLDSVKVPAGGAVTWEVPGLDGPEPMKSITGIIVHQHDARGYWEHGMDETGGGEPPACSSHDAVTGSGAPGGPCAHCPLAVFGSAGDGDRPACKSTKNLYVVTAESMLPIVLPLPPMSIKPAKQYLLRLAARGIRASSVVTKISLVQDKNKGGITYAKAVFEMAERLQSEVAQQVKAYAETIHQSIA